MSYRRSKRGRSGKSYNEYSWSDLESDLDDYKRKDKRRRKDEEEFDIPKINDLSDLITAASAGKKYRNINNDKLRRITPALKKLNNMKGLDEIKITILGQIMYYMQHLHLLDDDYMHTVITGHAGSGKTTLAEILADIYCHLGLLATGAVHKVHAKDLIGKYIGHTANMTMDAVKNAFGGVLLIDEAYSIGGDPNHIPSFNRECVNALNQCLSEYKKDFVCIIVGYKNSLRDNFFSLNEGLERRFAWRFDTGDVPFDNLADIFRGQASKVGWDVASDAIPDKFFSLNKDFFSAGGGATETLLSKCKIAYGRRMFGCMSSGMIPTITADDFNAGFKEFCKNQTPKPQISPPPEHMYI